ncbi:MAG: S-layer homology domain-containing protein [Clostridia bacterium]|nr:S-layer homology domain-containing protein [Clostridia bacterium]
MKKFICLVMALVCLFTVTSYAATTSFKDVKNTKYEDAVEMLTTFGIINGFNDNTFRPNESVTRGQLAKMLVVAMGYTENDVKAASKKFLSFSDVLSSHWAYGYIKIASDKKLINGYTDGTFKPDSTVSYAEATTMLLRALEFEDAVSKSTLTWPNNYMSYADEELDLFKDVGEFKANNAAPRGPIAILLWNTLRTGIADIVGENNKGLVYGEGTPMITKYMNYVYVEDAKVKEIEFDDDYKTAKVTLKEEDKISQKITVKAEEALEMFGKSVTVLLDNTTKEIVLSDYETDYKVIMGEVTNINKTKIYISSRSTGYDIPDDDNILLYGIEYIDDAVEVIMLVEGNAAKYCIAMGASEALPGFVANDYVEIADDQYGIRVRKPGATKGGDDYYIANDDAWPVEDNVILYYINSDDLLVVLAEVDIKDAAEINELKDDYIKIASYGTYEFDDEDDCTVTFVKSSSITTAKLSDVDVNMDTVCPVRYGAHLYLFVYEDDIINSLPDDLVIALYDLEDVIEEALGYDEEDYTQESYAKLMEEVYYGKKLTYNSTVKKINNAIIDIEDAIAYLDDEVSRSELKITKAKKQLRELINGECKEIIEDEFDYTDDSYENFEDMYEEAAYILGSYDALLTEVQDAHEDLLDAIDELKYIE